jgi:hypothetical protein
LRVRKARFKTSARPKFLGCNLILPRLDVDRDKLAGVFLLQVRAYFRFIDRVAARGEFLFTVTWPTSRAHGLPPENGIAVWPSALYSCSNGAVTNLCEIYHDVGSDTPQELTVAELRRLIEEAGRVPVERDTLYHEVIRTERGWQTGQSLALPVVAV